MIIIPEGGIVRDKATGEVLGKVQRLELVLKVNAGPMISALKQATTTARITGDEMRKLLLMLGFPRLETLRYQARRKGRPGWRSIKIPKGLKPASSHDDRVDALGHTPCS